MLLAPRAKLRILKKIDQIILKYPIGNKILDVGCGPSSYLFEKKLNPIGLDIAKSYIEKYNASGHKAFLGSSVAMSFKDKQFDSVWSFGLFHHLTDSQFEKTVSEMMRVCKKNGYIIIFDAVLPYSFLEMPLAWVIRKMDRGAFMRKENHIYKLLPNKKKWELKRYVYALVGLEMMIMIFKNN